MQADLPSDEMTIDMFMETIAGLETYNQMKQSTDESIKRRMLIATWLYIQGFLEHEFPAIIKYIPGHMMNDYEVMKPKNDYEL